MENASNALIMAASVLIGVMVLSMGVYLFSQFSTTSNQISKEIFETQLAEFNAQFTKLEGTPCSAHQIVSICNLAKENNRNYYGNEWTTVNYDDSPYYIKVIVNGAGYTANNANNFEKLEEINTNEKYENFIKNFDISVDYSTDPNTPNTVNKITFSCVVEISDLTKRVHKVTFTKL